MYCGVFILNPFCVKNWKMALLPGTANFFLLEMGRIGYDIQKNQEFYADFKNVNLTY
jgi:hypothetical protein